MTTALLEISDMAAVMPLSLAQHYARLGLLRVLPLDLPIHVPPIYLITRLDQRRLAGASPIQSPTPTPLYPDSEAARRLWERTHEESGPGSIWRVLG